MGGAIPGLVIPGSIRKQTNQAMMNKPVNSNLHGLASAPTSRFLPSLLLMSCDLEVEV